MTRYNYDRESGVWKRHNQTIIPITSKSGRAHELFEAFKESNQQASLDKVQNIVRDWPSSYHFDMRRLNLLSEFNFPNNLTLLELGCGYGTITRQLGETGSLVHSIERNHSAAQITAARCKDLDNVKIFIDSISGFSAGEKI